MSLRPVMEMKGCGRKNLPRGKHYGIVDNTASVYGTKQFLLLVKIQKWNKVSICDLKLLLREIDF